MNDLEPIPDLSEKQMTAIEMMANGTNIDEIADHLGVHRSSVYRWRNSDAAIRYFDTLMTNRFRDVLPGVLGVMVEKIHHPKSNLMAVVKGFEALSNRAGFPEEKRQQDINDGKALGIQINLGDGVNVGLSALEPSQLEAQNRELRQRIEELEKANTIQGEVKDVSHE